MGSKNEKANNNFSDLLFPMFFAGTATLGYHSALTGESTLAISQNLINANIILSGIGVLLSVVFGVKSKGGIIVIICGMMAVYTSVITAIGMYLVFSDFMYDAKQCAIYLDVCEFEKYKKSI
ncbi:hypothetical protein HYN96_23355 [Vibrio parahaemolyticus]|nr:hypothetical protein [Vibrio parahaemolyticus]MBM5105932.1 hypothetical protein [Vibrio parahaemolyticus]